MKNTHTPGPWRTVINMEQSNLRDILASGDSNGIFISSNANESNARLIAAAPELLTALEWALEQLEDDLDPDYQAAFDAAMETVRKAKGIQ
jgi:hypothetical protein